MLFNKWLPYPGAVGILFIYLNGMSASSIYRRPLF